MALLMVPRVGSAGQGGSVTSEGEHGQAMRACGDRNPNAIRASSLILVLTDSISPWQRPWSSAAWMDFRCLVMRRDNCTNTGMRQRRAQEIQRSFAFFALNGEDVSHQSSYGSFGEDRGFDGSFVKDQRRSMPPVRQPHGPNPQRLPSRSMISRSTRPIPR